MAQDLRAPLSLRPAVWRVLHNKDVLAGLLFMVVALIGLWVSRDYPIGTALRMSTGYVPRLLCWVLFLLGAGVVATGLRGREGGSAGHSGVPRATVLMPAALVAFALTIERFGLVVASALMLAIGSLAIRGLRAVEAITTGIVLVLLTWGIFVKALGLTIRVWPEW
jgi:putative tricarboxylic transport membrane protein